MKPVVIQSVSTSIEIQTGISPQSLRIHLSELKNHNICYHRTALAVLHVAESTFKAEQYFI
jgi:hypothetical protein